MLNVHELERTWLRYKIKQYLPRIAAGIVLTTVASIIYWSSFSDMDSDIINEDSIAIAISSPADVTSAKSSIEENTAIVTPVPKTVTLPKTIQPEPTVSSVAKAIDISPVQDDNGPSRILRPSITFMDTLENDARSHPVKKPIKTASPKETLSRRPAITPKPTSKAIETKKVQETPTPIKKIPGKSTIRSEPKRSAITIIAKQDEEDIKNVIKRFKKNKNPALSLFIARQYYENGRYQKAYNYALITNNINSDIEDSWLIFARSLVKLEQKEMAKKALSSYIGTSDSARAKMLLDEIIHGDFK